MTSPAERFLLRRLSSGATVLLALLLDVSALKRPAGAVPNLSSATPHRGVLRGSPSPLAEPLSWAAGDDVMGRAIYLVGAHALRQLPDGEAALAAVVTALAAGEVPDGVLAIDYKPMASAAWAEAVFGRSEQVLVDGPRGTGKTQVTPAILAALAEEHVRAGFTLPLRTLWLHTSLTNARDKTVASLEQPHWGGLWSFHDDKQTALLTLGGLVTVKASFVGTRDEASQDRARNETMVVIGEEVVSSLEESGGIEERKFDLAKSSMSPARLPTRRYVAVAVTNPGASDHWLYKRFIEGGGRPGCVRCQIPASDRLTAEEIGKLERDYEGSPDLQARLGRGEWSDLLLGEVVAAG
jgi:hypothetical protein